MSKEKIIGVAISINEDLGSFIGMPKPYRHHHIINNHGKSLKGLVSITNQGFYTSKGRFVDRVKAREIAINCDQVKVSDLNEYASELFSEDVW